ncbi:ferric-chelate reductase 1 [Fukomys damarensis]|uniref:Ferric-chelate reductase 1 n=1 Tax=Fukomys damarensis TaxID=885580 RepID=A0A091D8R2_FUKDA|nr:ferric-chelate reductase 1 [Fukomys damarensis]XP_010637350.1 ferric-chelate reductase 1 [Fukomys damarensis]XP_010637351.1 ferric-chelate reductase 1 [Fukomys damarensis]XP_010637352.1 ferric-chelate reductase 1 [Fukomys damarensis]XP_010637353.1 ferric-chelate reductase 1 [Fukomys damarensis]XP_010637354.1 ferric-chelate reductase 1 [Fukomys damarensis]XP_010637355.1 ferric-chelate reductase 1 [Fukomys damarensis]XP_019065309.1 ferric-chelate reductase 1 [Fukomys damarensis]KFO26878.1 
MAVPGFTLGAFVFLLHVSSVASYPNGKVTQSCHRMIPKHGHSPRPEPTHHMALSQTTFRPGDQIEVTLSGQPFKGFLVEARNAEDLDGPPVGSFMLIDHEVSQLLTCDDIQGSAVSHTSSSNKTEIKVYWKAPSSAPNHIRFLATVVKNYKIYWVKIPSQIISQPNVLPFTTPKATTAPSSTSPPISHSTKPFSASGCGNKKFCIRSPLNCDPEKQHACIFLSFTRDDQSVAVEMSGPSQGYLSFAFSHDRWMGDDDAYMCIREDQTVHIQPSHLTGRSHPVMDSSGSLEDMAWRLVDGIIQCSFRRNITLPGVKNRFDLNTSYYIFLADGVASDGRIYRHSQQPLITHEKHNVTDSPKDVGGSRSSLLLKVHGALMFVAWMSTVSIGVLIARFFRPVWAKAFFFGEAVWFQLHRMLMVTTSVLTCIAFVMPFIYRGGWSWHAGYHPYLGCVVMTLAVLQPLLAAFRPSFHDPRRQIFNWTHWSVGTAARIIAVAAMFLGMDLPGLTLPEPQKTYAMIGFVIWHIGTEIVLEIHAYRLSRKVEILDDDRIQILQSLTVSEVEGHTFKKMVLAVYVCGNMTFLIIFLSAISHL